MTQTHVHVKKLFCTVGVTVLHQESTRCIFLINNSLGVSGGKQLLFFHNDWFSSITITMLVNTTLYCLTVTVTVIFSFSNTAARWESG